MAFGSLWQHTKAMGCRSRFPNRQTLFWKPSNITLTARTPSRRDSLLPHTKSYLSRAVLYREGQNTDVARAPSVFWILGPPVFWTTWHKRLTCNFVFWAGPKLILGSIIISKSVFCTTSILNFPVECHLWVSTHSYGLSYGLAAMSLTLYPAANLHFH